jgi:hypothetical protein
MTELRNFHNMLQEHNLSLEMRNLPRRRTRSADRLSRRRRAFDYQPGFPPLKLLALVPENVTREDFKG